MVVRVTSKLPYAIAAVGAVLVVVLSFGVFFSQTTITNDLSTYLLPAVARENNLGLVYVDYLDIKPPLIFGLFVPWVAIFGSSLPSMWVLYAVLLLSLFAAFFIALRQELQPWLAVTVFTFGAIAVVSFSMLEEFFFVTEVVGSAIALWALVVARWRGSHLGWLYGAALLLGAAGQVKDVFLFAPAALLPIAWVHRSRIRAMGTLVAGVISAFALTTLLLTWWGDGVLRAYWEVLQLKRGRFPLPTPTDLLDHATEHVYQLWQWLPWISVFVIVCAITIASRVIRGRRGQKSSWPSAHLSVGEWMLIFYFAAMYLGFLWQGSALLKYFALALVFPAYLFLAVLLRHFWPPFNEYKPATRVLVGILLLVGIAPSFQAISWAGGRATSLISPAIVDFIPRAESEDDLALYDQIRELAGPETCLHVAYGFSATTYYLYTKIPPCTRFTLPPLVTQTPALWQPQAEDLAARPPGILVVDPLLAAGEDAVFPYSEVAARCYQQSPNQPIVYLPRGNATATRECILKTVQLSKS